jgi:hypothetical protein
MRATLIHGAGEVRVGVDDGQGEAVRVPQAQGTRDGGVVSRVGAPQYPKVSSDRISRSQR